MPTNPLFATTSPASHSRDKLNDDHLDQHRWNILIVDDEESIHQLTHLILDDFVFQNSKLNIISAYTGEDAMAIMRQRNDIALLLLDVVMENDNAGLEVARYIREDLKNHYTRIVLRTAQPGHAPEAKVIRDYDIDDYKDKTELTDIKLFTVIYSALRAYRDVCILDMSRRGLEKVIKSSMEIFQSDTMHTFASAMLAQVTNMLNLDESALYCTSIRDNNKFKILAATGDMTQLLGDDDFDKLPENVRHGFGMALEAKHSIHNFNSFVGYYKTTHGNESLLYVSHRGRLSALDKQLLEIYSANVAIGYENLLMQEDITDTQKELIYILGDAVEERSSETGWHVKRIAHICHLLAVKAGLSEDAAELIKLASPLHDIGKVGIPDAVLNKPGPHTPAEWEVMKTHAQAGHNLLGKSDRKILRMASTIAGQHHEKWDGSGYPIGLKGEEIDISARICALADVFDALGSTRCYKQPWPLERILEHITDERGRHFDPALVDVFLKNISEFCKIRQLLPDA